MSLVVDGTAFSFGDAVHNSTNQWVWADSGLNWADGDRVAVRLLGPPPPPVALVSATVSGTALTLTYDTGMDQTSVPAASAFTVAVDAATTTVSSVAVAGAEVTLTLASTPASTATVTVDYAAPATNPLRSLPAAIVPTFSDQPVAHIVDLVKNRSKAAAAGRGFVGTTGGVSYASAQQFATGETRPAICWIPSSSTLRESRRTATRESAYTRRRAATPAPWSTHSAIPPAWPTGGVRSPHRPARCSARTRTISSL